MKERGKLNLLFILKDEAETIEEAIKAFHFEDGRKLYHRLIVGIDDSTADDTEKIVRKYTNEVSFFTWEEDFSKHRNTLIDKVTEGEWVVYPDGHEILRPKGLVILDKFLDEQPTMANVYSPYIEIDVDEYDVPDIVFRRPIIFKHTGYVRFKRKVHNFLYDDKENKIAQLPEVSFTHNMPHKRKEMRSSMRKDMNLRELEKTTKTAPKDTRENFYLSDVYEEGGDFGKAMEGYERTFRMADIVDPDMAAQTCISAMNCLYKLKKYDEAIKWGFRGMNNKSDRAELFHFMGLNLYSLKRYGEALHWYSLATLMCLPETTYFLMGKIYSWYPWEGIMLCNLRLEKYEASLKAAKRILLWKTNKVTGEKCAYTLQSIKNLEEAIEKSKSGAMLNQKIMDSAADTIKNYGEKAELKVV